MTQHIRHKSRDSKVFDPNFRTHFGGFGVVCAMPKKELQKKLVEELRAWCGEPIRRELRSSGRGCQGYRSQARSHRRLAGWPSSSRVENGLKLQAFLKKQRRKNPN